LRRTIRLAWKSFSRGTRLRFAIPACRANGKTGNTPFGVRSARPVFRPKKSSADSSAPEGTFLFRG